MNATSIYRAIMLECERQRYALGWPMWQVDEKAGTQDNYYAKAVHADAASGRQAQWKTLDWIIGALFENGFDLIIKAKPGASIPDRETFQKKVGALRAAHDPLSQRERMRVLGDAGRAAYMAKTTPEQRKKWGRRAARARWRKAKESASAVA